MQESDGAASVPDCLLDPEDRLAGAGAGVRRGGGVLGDAAGLPGWCEGQDYEEGVCGAGDVGEEIGVGEAVDVVEGEGRGEAEGVG